MLTLKYVCVANSNTLGKAVVSGDVVGKNCNENGDEVRIRR